MKQIFTFILFLFIAGEISSQTTYTYTGKPRFEIVTKVNNTVMGIINIELFPTIAPKHVRNFDSLVSTKFYDTTAFHRCVPGFVIQGGDPNSRTGPISSWGFGNPNQPTVDAEFSVAKHLRGSFSAARSTNINSATSQFFICVAPASNLNGQYSLYGKVTSGMTVADAIVNAPKKAAPYASMPLQKIEMFVTYTGSNDTVPVPPNLTTPKDDSLEVPTNPSIQLKWSAVSDAVIYHIELSKDANFNTVYNFKSSNLFYNLNFLDQSSVYYWRIRTDNGGHLSPYSQTRKFSTTWSTVGVESVGNNNGTAQVFPNPGTGKYTFSNLNKGELVEVFDAQGKLISSGEVKDTLYKIDLEGENKGIYLYRVTGANKKVQQGKLILK